MNRSEEATTRWLCTKAAAQYCGIHFDTLRRLRREGGGPPFTRVPGTRAVRYDVNALDAWMRAATFASTAEEAAGDAQ